MCTYDKYWRIFKSVASWCVLVHACVLLQCVKHKFFGTEIKKVKCLDHWYCFVSVHHYTLISIIIYTCNVKKFEYQMSVFWTFIFDILQNKLLNNTKTLLKEAAEREQRLLTENQDLKQRVGQRSRSIQLSHWLSYNYLMIKGDNSV